ncbi:MAG: cysteine desulfurase, partial [Bacteroidales bacterium]|nr:cysteine desulfurase [Bacteroidales bacterium]
MKQKKIYLDHNATTPLDLRVLDEMLPYFTEKYGNAASNDHDFGYEAKLAVDKARKQVAKSINAFPDEIIFTSGATESNNIVLFGVAEKYKTKGKHIITCVTEHKAVLDCCHELETRGFDITYLPVDQFGIVSLKALRDAIRPDTILISIMAANNEIGTIAPMGEIGRIAKENEILFHSDGAQAVGNIPIDVQKMNIDVLSISSHKIYGPKGIGALYRRRSNPRVNLSPVIYGGGHEKGLRSGTLNVPGIVGLGKALEISVKEMKKNNAKYLDWITYLWDNFIKSIPDTKLNGPPEKRLPNNLNISIPGIESKALIVQLKEIAISTGSACTSSIVEPSHVIISLGFGEERAHSSIRIGVGRFNNSNEISDAS